MSKIARILTSLVAAIPAGLFLYVFFIEGLLANFTEMPTSMKVGTAIAGLASIILAVLPLLTAAGLFAGGARAARPAKVKRPKKSKVEPEIEDAFDDEADAGTFDDDPLVDESLADDSLVDDGNLGDGDLDFDEADFADDFEIDDAKN